MAGLWNTAHMDDIPGLQGSVQILVEICSGRIHAISSALLPTMAAGNVPINMNDPPVELGDQWIHKGHV